MIPAKVRVHIRRLVMERSDADLVSALPDGIEAAIASMLAVPSSNNPPGPIRMGAIEHHASPLARAVGSGIVQKITGLAVERR